MARPTGGSHFQLVTAESLTSPEPVPLTGFVKLKPSNHNKGSKIWRPLELTDLESSDENRTDIYPIGEECSYAPQNAPAECPPSMSTQPTNSFSAVDPVTALTEHMENLSRIFGERLPDSTFLTQNEGSYDNQIVFILHPNGDVQAHQWAAQSYQWVNLGQYSYRRKRIEGQLEKEKLRGQKIGGGLPPNTVQYFLAVAKQREQDCRNSLTDLPQAPFQNFVASSLSQPEVRYPLLCIGTDNGRHTALSSTGSSIITALPTTTATISTVAAGTVTPRHSSMNTNSFIHDPFIVRSVNNQTEFSEYVSSPTDTNTDIGPLTQLDVTGDHTYGKVDKGKSVVTVEYTDRLLTDPFLPYRTRRPSSAIADSSISEGHNFLTAKPIQEHEATKKWAYIQDKERISSSSLAQQYQQASDALQMALLGNEASRLEPESQNLTQHDPGSPSGLSIGLENIPLNSTFLRSTKTHYAGPDTAVHHVPVMNFTTKHSRQIGAPGRSEPFSTLHILREGKVEAAWRDRQGNFLQKGTATSNMSNEELELYSRSTPQDWNGPFFPDKPPNAGNLFSPGFTGNKKSYQELAGWWHSGNMRDRQEDYLKVLQKAAAARALPQGGWSDDWSLDHALYPVFENLKAYVEKRTHMTRDYFARFAKPPDWCINNTPTGRKSFFGEDYGTPPARLGRYVTKPTAALPFVALHSTFTKSEKSLEG